MDDDRREFLTLLRDACGRFGLKVQAYCLMSNHYHLIAVPKGPDSLHLALKWVSQLYTQYVNRLHGRSGHLWQDRFFSCALDDEHFWAAMAYVERNPVRARLAREARAYPWSSAAAHCGGADAWGLVDLANWRKRLGPLRWEEALADPGNEKTLASLRLCTSRGRPLGGDKFLAKLEVLLGRRLRPLPRGRPKKAKKAE